jgi:salicylate hydroxylase
MEDKYGARWWALHRVDLHGELLRLATTTDIPGKPAVMRLVSEAIGLDYEEGLLTIKDGTQIKKDLKVLADGSHSHFLSAIAGTPIKIYRTGIRAYRSLVPSSEINGNPLTRALWENEAPGFYDVELPTGAQAITYPCRDSTLLNSAVIHPDNMSNATLTELEGDNWHNTATQEDVISCLEGMHPTWSKVCEMTEEVKVFTVMTHEPLQNVVRGKAVLIGDSAHPMLPTHGQGTAQAIEDAAALEIVFGGDVGEGDVEELLKVYQRVRLGRGAITQILSNKWMTPELVEKVKSFDENAVIPSEETPPFTEGIWDFFYPGDPHEDARKAMENFRKGSKEMNGTATNRT